MAIAIDYTSLPSDFIIAQKPFIDCLMQSVVAYDSKILKRNRKNPKVYHNIFALGLMIDSIQNNVIPILLKHGNRIAALKAGFTDTLLAHVAKQCGKDGFLTVNEYEYLKSLARGDYI